MFDLFRAAFDICSVNTAVADPPFFPQSPEEKIILKTSQNCETAVKKQLNMILQNINTKVHAS